MIFYYSQQCILHAWIQRGYRGPPTPPPPPPPWKITKLLGSFAIFVWIHWKITKLPSQLSLLGHYWPANTILMTTNRANKKLVSHVRLPCGSQSITTPVSLLANEFDVQSVLHEQVSLAAVNQICVIHETMNGCKNLRIHKRFASKM